MGDETSSRPWRLGTAPATPSAPPPAAPAASPGPEPGRRRWLILAVVGMAQLMVVLDGKVTEYNSALDQGKQA